MLLSPAASQTGRGQWGGERKTGEKETASWSVGPRRERWLATSPKAPPSFPQWTSSSKGELPTSSHQVPRKVRGKEWMDSNGAEAGAWGLDGGHAGIRRARAQQDPMREGAHPAVMPHSMWASPEPRSHSSALSPPPPQSAGWDLSGATEKSVDETARPTLGEK